MSDKTIKRVLRIFLGLLLTVSVVLSIIFVVKISGTDEREALMNAIERVIDWTYCLLIIAAACAIIFPIIFIVLRYLNLPIRGSSLRTSSLVHQYYY